MGIRISAIFLMAVLAAGFSSFPSSISNSSPEFPVQTNSLNLVSTAFADSDDDEDDEDGEDKQKGKPEGVGKGQDKKLAQNQVKDDDDEYEDDVEYEEGKEEEHDEEIEIEAEVEDGVATVEVEIGDEEFEFEFILTATDPDAIREEIENEILARTDLTIEQLGFLEIEFDDDIQEFSHTTHVKHDGTTTICHIPPGNPGNAHLITISRAAEHAHLAHGDMGADYCAQNSLGDILSKKEMKLLEKEVRLAEKQSDKESKALERAEKLIEKLEQRIAKLEQRLQTLLDKVESGEYFGNLSQVDAETNSHSISLAGTATSIHDESETTEFSGKIFIENLATGNKVSKFKVTSGDILVGDEIYDAAFGKARISSLGTSGEKDSIVIIIQTFDSDDNDNTIKLILNFDSALPINLGTEPLDFEIKSNSKISEQWFLSGSGTLSLE